MKNKTRKIQSETLIPVCAALGNMVKEYSNKEVASAAGISTGAVTNWSRGFSTPTGDDLKNLERFFAGFDLPDSDQPNPHYIEPREVTDEVKRLRSYMSRHNLEAKDVAAVMGISPSTVNNWLISDSPPQFKNRGLIINYLSTGARVMDQRIHDIESHVATPAPEDVAREQEQRVLFMNEAPEDESGENPARELLLEAAVRMLLAKGNIPDDIRTFAEVALR